MSDPLDPETYGPPLTVAPGAHVHPTGPVRLVGEWTPRGEYLERADGARVYLLGWPVYVEGPVVTP